jgi:hypothetical protein
MHFSNRNLFLFSITSDWTQLYMNYHWLALYKFCFHWFEVIVVLGQVSYLIATYIIVRTNYIFLVLAHWNNNLQLDMSLHSHTLSWFRTNQSLLLHLNTAWLSLLFQWASTKKYNLFSQWYTWLSNSSLGLKQQLLTHLTCNK